RTPQVRWRPILSPTRELALAVENPGSAVDAGEVSWIDPTLNIRAYNKYPDFSAHYREDQGWGHWQIASIVRWNGYETSNTADGRPTGNKIGGGVSLGGHYNLKK